MKYIELFAGIGGFRYGLENVTATKRKKQRVSKKGKGRSRPNSRKVGTQQFNCVYANEWDKYAGDIYEKNYKEKIDRRDIREVSTEDLPDFDLLVAGFPCQAFSVAGKRGGFDDTRGTLFFEIARIAKQKQPRFLLLENVKGLLSHDKGKTFGTILNTLAELGYDCQWQVLNSKDFGVPQNRERVFIVGHLRGYGRPQIFPFGEPNPKDIKQLNKPRHSNDRIYGKEGLSPTLNTMQGGRRQPKISYALDANYWKGTSEKDYLTRKRRQLVYTPKVRRLTPTECERLQGFPDGWTEGISNTQRYKCLGNAVTTNVITAIGNKLIKEF